MATTYPERLEGETPLAWAERCIRAIPAPEPRLPDTKRVAFLRLTVAACTAPEISEGGYAGFVQIMAKHSTALDARRSRAKRLLEANMRGVSHAERRRLLFSAQTARIQEKARLAIAEHFAAMDARFARQPVEA